MNETMYESQKNQALPNQEMTNKNVGCVYLVTSKDIEVVKLGLCKEIDENIRNKCTAWYGKSTQIISFDCTNKKRLKQKFQSTFREQMNTPSLFTKEKLIDYVKFLSSITKTSDVEEQIQYMNLK